MPTDEPAHPHSAPLELTGDPLTPQDVESVTRQGRKVVISTQARDRIEASRSALEAIVARREPVYGVNTGFGSLARRRIGEGKLADVQHNLIRSHAAGVGEPLATEIVRGMMLLLAASLSRGHSGVRLEVVETIIAQLNAGVSPIVPSIGSVGASGDLAPLAHIALVLLGEGRAELDGQTLEGAEALRRAKIKPLTLTAKEGLALINGTHLMAARGALFAVDISRVFDAALVACAMSIDAMRATDAFLDDRIHTLRTQPGQRRVASRLRTMLEGSQIIPSHIEDDPRVQDPYSFRCAAQVLGASLDLIEWTSDVLRRELGAVTDNPLIFEDDDGPHAISAGNFHGAPLALALDALSMALAHVAGISERRVFALLSAADPESHLRPHLSSMPGLHSGLMITQYTAAACCNEMIGLANPASVANIPTCAGMEDYNSFGPRAAAKAARSLELCTHVVAIELLCAAQGIEHHRPLRSGHVVERAIESIREVVPTLAEDRPPAPDIQCITALILGGVFGE